MPKVLEQTESQVDFIPWDRFLSAFKWRQGEHVTLLGVTGQGKTTLARAIMPRRNFVLSFGTKRKDERYKELENDGFRRMKEWLDMPAELEPKRLLVPKFRQDEPREREQVAAFADALDRAFDDGGWTVHIPEITYIVNDLGLKQRMKRLWQQGRSLKVTVVCEGQRPAWVPLEAYSQATHLFFFGNKDEVDTKRMGGLGGIDRKLIAREISLLDSHRVLYLNTRTGELMRTKVNRKG